MWCLSGWMPQYFWVQHKVNKIQSHITEFLFNHKNKQKAVLPLTGGMGAGIGITAGILMLIIVLMVKKNQIYVVKVPNKKSKHK